MKEIFCEESATVSNEKAATIKYNIFKTVSVISYVLMVLWILIVFIAFDWSGNIIISLIFVLVPLIMFLLSGILFGKFKNKLYVDYDYTFVTGSIRVAKVIKNIKRKFVIKFETSAIEKIGVYGSETFDKYYNMPGITKMTLTSNVASAENKDFYYIVANIDGDKKLMIFECTETFIVNVLKFSNKMVLEQEFSKK